MVANVKLAIAFQVLSSGISGWLILPQNVILSLPLRTEFSRLDIHGVSCAMKRAAPVPLPELGALRRRLGTPLPVFCDTPLQDDIEDDGALSFGKADVSYMKTLGPFICQNNLLCF